MAATVRVPESAFKQLVEEGWSEIQLTLGETEILAGVVSAAFDFFRADPAEKAKCQAGTGIGYRPYGIEYSKAADRPDEMETFSTTVASMTHVYPLRDAAELNRRTAAAFSVLERIAEQLIVAIANRLTNGTWQASLAGGVHRWSTLQINYSRPSQVRSSFINEEHEDGHFLTLVYGTAPGLEVRMLDGTFRPVSTSDRPVAMLGGVAALMTDGRLQPLFHQVRPSHDCDERISILFFADLAPELCQPWIVGETNRDVDIARFIRSNPVRFGLQKYGSD